MQYPQLAELCKIASEWTSRRVSVVLFGSRARGDHEPWSDWDLLVVADEFTSDDSRKLHKSVSELRSDLQLVTRAEYESRLEKWKALHSGAAHSRLSKNSRAMFAVAASALEGQCLVGEEHFQPFIDQFKTWIYDGQVTDPELCQLPSIQDGLTGPQRMLLAAVPLGTNRNRKCAKVVEQASKEGIAGSSFLYRLLVRMVQPWVTSYPLLAGQGNLGSQNGHRWAAMRYTECRASKVFEFGGRDGALRPDDLEAAADAIRSLASREDRVTADDALAVLRSSLKKQDDFEGLIFPNLLANGTVGIPGAGASLPPFALTRVTQAIQLAVENPQASDDQLLEVIDLPRFPTGGVIQNPDEVREALLSGEGTIELRADEPTVELSRDKKTQAIVVRRFAYGMTGWAVQEQLESAVKSGLLPGAKKIVDVSDVDGPGYELTLSKDADADELLSQVGDLPLMSVKVPIDLTVTESNSSSRRSLPDLIRHDAETRLERLEGNRASVLTELSDLASLS